MAEDRDRDAERREHELRPAVKSVRLLGREIRLAATETGELLAEVRSAMGAEAAGIEPEELNRVGFSIYEGFQPEVPAGAVGWGAKGELQLRRLGRRRMRMRECPACSGTVRAENAWVGMAKTGGFLAVPFRTARLDSGHRHSGVSRFLPTRAVLRK
jgi:hypothetical protein